MKTPKTKYFILFCIIVSICIGCAQFSGISNIRKPEDVKEPSENRNLKFMTFNIRAGGGREDPGLSPYYVHSTKEKLKKIASAIKSVDPNVIALQEVRGYQQIKFIAETLNLNFSYVTHSHWWGLAILSKFKISKVSTKMIHGGDDPRVGQVCKIDIMGKPISFVNVHYHLGHYEQQVKATMKFFMDKDGPVVLLGDLNRREWDFELEPIQKILLDTCLAVETEDSKIVRHVGTGYGRIDYIFVDSKFFKVRNVGIANEYWKASDHYAYFAEVKLKNTGSD